MKILRTVALCLWVLALLASCAGGGRATVDYRKSPFRAEVRFVSEGVTVCAEVETELREGVLVPSRVRLLAPPSLAGIELVRRDGTLILCRDGLSVPSVGAEGWWEAAALLCCSGNLRYVCQTEWSGLALEYAEIDGVCGIYREADTGTPRRIVKGERELTVIRFEPIGARA